MDDISIFQNMKVSGQSGLDYIFDYIIKSSNMMIAAKIYRENTTTNDIMIFNSEAMDAGITKKLILSLTEITEYIKKMCNVYGIDILDIKQLDETSQQRVKFGILTLDTKLSGGLRPGYVYMISGKPGAGKTTMASIFLSYGASLGEKGLMILTDTFPDQFLDNIRTMDIGFIDYYNKKMLNSVFLRPEVTMTVTPFIARLLSIKLMQSSSAISSSVTGSITTLFIFFEMIIFFNSVTTFVINFLKSSLPLEILDFIDLIESDISITSIIFLL